MFAPCWWEDWTCLIWHVRKPFFFYVHIANNQLDLIVGATIVIVIQIQLIVQPYYQLTLRTHPMNLMSSLSFSHWRHRKYSSLSATFIQQGCTVIPQSQPQLFPTSFDFIHLFLIIILTSPPHVPTFTAESCIIYTRYKAECMRRRSALLQHPLTSDVFYLQSISRRS